MLNRLFFLFLCAVSTLEGAEKAPALQQLHTKETIQTLLKDIGKASKDKKGPLLVDLALAYYRDQEAEKAFQAFLEGIEITVAKSEPKPSEEERKLYDEALELYLSQNSGPAAVETAQKILEKYGPIVKQHPDHYLLGFLVAAAYANLGQFDHFFEQFYQSFQRYPKSHMAFRTKGVLHIKLYEKARTEEEREKQRKEIFSLIMKAANENPEDSGLYKLMIAFSPGSEQQKVIQEVIGKIIDKDIHLPRGDIPFYVVIAMDSQQKELAQKFLDKAREWYPYSRVIMTAQELIK